MYTVGRELPIFAITRKKSLIPKLLHICQRKPNDGIRIIPLNGQERKTGSADGRNL